ncbi:MAG: STAS domain-containing protein [Gammaproteobacteria bacterium]|nr:STAS domain-containing protein [Gammaproteobacteria bacterium]MDE0413826.1 STAS domain-containing protein [Gammaproteobacteria bacterium]
MQIRTETLNGTLIAYAAGRIDGPSASDFTRSMQAVLGDEKAVVVDCHEVTEISSAGLSAFLMIARELQDQGVKFALCCMAPRVRVVFEMTGFDKIIPVHATREGALGLLPD